MITKEDVMDSERKYWRAMQELDIEAAVMLTHFPCLVTGPQGTLSIDEDEFRLLMGKQSREQFKDIIIQSPLVTVLNENTALISYNSEIGGVLFQDVSTWLKVGDKLICAYHAEYPLQ